MTITKTQNGIYISDIINGYLVKRLYVGYTKREAKKLFKKFVEERK